MVTFWQFYFRLFPGSIKGPQIVEFLAALNRQIPGPLLIIWDGLQAHKSKVVRQYIEHDDVDIQLAFLPVYVPELNPVDCHMAFPPTEGSRDNLLTEEIPGDRIWVTGNKVIDALLMIRDKLRVRSAVYW